VTRAEETRSSRTSSNRYRWRERERTGLDWTATTATTMGTTIFRDDWDLDYDDLDLGWDGWNLDCRLGLG